MNKGALFMIAVLAGLSCSTTEKNAVTTANGNVITPEQPNLTLASYLKRIPGVYVNSKGGETLVYIRGQNTFSEQREPLFVVDGQPIGYGYRNAENQVSVADIQSIRVLKSGAETSRFGLQGNNGVILITTKK